MVILNKLKILAFIFVLIFLFGMQDPRSHVLDFGPFKLKTPSDWIIIDQDGIDSYAGALTDKRDTLSFDLGWFSRSICNLDEEDIPNHKLAKDTVNGLIAYIIIPNQDGKGEIGMSIENFKDQQQKFVISGHNIPGTTMILDIFKSILFAESDSAMNPPLTFEKFNKTIFASGKKIFNDNCASCHNKRWDLTGPALVNISSRRSVDWIVTFLTNRKDLKLESKNKHKRSSPQCVEFPNLTREAIERILDYLN